MDLTVSIIGLGHLGEALLTGFLRAGLPADRIRGTARPEARAAELRTRHGIRVGVDNRAAVADADVVILTVPPGLVTDIAGDIAEALPATTVVVSFAAGVPNAALHSALSRTATIRAMTNTAVQVRQGMTALAPDDTVDEDRLSRVHELFASVGKVVTVPEAAMPVVTAIAGSGPAFLYHQAAAMCAAATTDDLDPATARTLVAQTMFGAAATLRDSGADPRALIAEVASPGGTTRAALDVLDSARVPAAVARAVDAAAARAQEP